MISGGDIRKRSKYSKGLSSTSKTSCCGPRNHLWDMYSVEKNWLPDTLRCLVVGESPGEDAEKYFYNQHCKVAVRTIIVRELSRHRLLSEPTLPSFKKTGFLFDHAIRCLLPSDAIHHEANLATRYVSPRVAASAHLMPFLREGSAVWVMGRTARNAVAVLQQGFPRDTSEIAKQPYPQKVPEAPRFLSRAICFMRVARRWRRYFHVCIAS